MRARRKTEESISPGRCKYLGIEAEGPRSGRRWSRGWSCRELGLALDNAINLQVGFLHEGSNFCTITL